MHFIAVLIGRETKNKRARYIVSVVLEEVFADEGCDYVPKNRRFPEITGKDNLTVFSYSGRVKSPERRWQRRRADLRHFDIFRHGPIIIYTRQPAGGTYYPICTFPASSECLIGISDAFSAFCFRVSVIFPTCSLNVPPTKACLLCATPAGMDLYIYIQVHARRLLPSAVPWISEDRLFSHCRRLGKFLS